MTFSTDVATRRIFDPILLSVFIVSAYSLEKMCETTQRTLQLAFL